MNRLLAILWARIRANAYCLIHWGYEEVTIHGPGDRIYIVTTAKRGADVVDILAAHDRWTWIERNP